MPGEGRVRFQSGACRGVLQSALTGVAARIRAEEASFWCLSPDGARMDLAVNHGPQAALLETLSVPVSESVVGLVQATRLATAIGPEEAHHPGVDEAAGVATRAMVAAPVLGPDGVLGVVSAINPEGRERFSGAELQDLALAAAALAPALAEALGHGA